jgi:hypothetical protein
LDAGARGDAAEAARVTGDAAAAARGAPARRGRGARPAPVSRCVLVCLFLGGVSLAVFLLPVLTLAFVSARVRRRDAAARLVNGAVQRGALPCACTLHLSRSGSSHVSLSWFLTCSISSAFSSTRSRRGHLTVPSSRSAPCAASWLKRYDISPLPVQRARPTRLKGHEVAGYKGSIYNHK